MSKVKKFLAIMLTLVLSISMIPTINVSAAKKVKLNKTKATIYVGKTVTLKLKNNKAKVKWNSSNKKVATVTSKGKVKGKKAGKATITAKVGKKKYKCKITVKAVQKNGNPITNNQTEQTTTSRQEEITSKQEVQTTKQEETTSKQEVQTTKQEETTSKQEVQTTKPVEQPTTQKEVTKTTKLKDEYGVSWFVEEGTNTIKLEKYCEQDYPEELIIPAKIQGKKVVEIGKSILANQKHLKSVMIEEGVETIGHEAFYNCTSLTSITIPNSVTTIGNMAFNGCIRLKSIIIPDSVTILGYSSMKKDGGVFGNCEGLESITLSNRITEISNELCKGCSSLKSVTIPYGVTKIYFDAFMFSGLTNVEIPNSVTTIYADAFAYTHLTSVTIPNSVTGIGRHAFSGNPIIKGVTGSYAETWANENGYAFTAQ